MRESKSYYVNFGQKSQKFDKVFVTDTFFLQDSTNFSVKVDQDVAGLSSTDSLYSTDSVSDEYVFFNAEQMREAIIFVRNAGLTTLTNFDTTVISNSFGIGFTEDEFNDLDTTDDKKKILMTYLSKMGVYSKAIHVFIQR